MDSAEVYMTLIRPSMVPVFGEAAPLEFTGQIELNNWSWTLKNEQEDIRAAKAAKAYNDRTTFLEHRNSTDLRKQIQELTRMKSQRTNQKSFDEQQDSLMKQLAKAQAKNNAGEVAEIEEKLRKSRKNFLIDQMQVEENYRVGIENLKFSEQKEATQFAKETEQVASDMKDLDDQMKRLNKDADTADSRSKYDNFEFSFSKRVDIATTQMLNSMKAGDVFPVAILTLHQRAAKFNHGASLIITCEKLRLLDYQLKCEISETMTDMREEWTAEFFSMAYVYKNRGQIKQEKAIGQAITAALTQGTIRTFTMKNSSLPSLPI